MWVFFLGSLTIDGQAIKLNRTIISTCPILKLIAASTAEAELGALFLNSPQAKILRLILTKLGHLQPPTIILIYKTTTVVIVNNAIKQQILQAMVMHYFWILDQYCQNYFYFKYQLGQ